MEIMQILIYIVVALGGYILGRLGHKYGGHWRYVPHHWIYGILLIIIGAIYYQYPIALYLVSVGVGVAISDLYDLLHFRIHIPDQDPQKTFFGFD